MLAGISVNYVGEQTTGFSNPILFSVLCQALVVGLAILCHEGIEKAEPWFALLILLAMAYVFVIAFTGHAPVEYIQVPIDASLGFTPALALDIVIFLSVMATNTMVVYGMVNSVVGAQSRTPLKFLPVALILGAVSIVGSTWLSLLDQYTDFLTMIGAFFVPVFAIRIVDYYIIKRGTYTRDILRDSGGLYSYIRGVNWAAAAVWVIGALVSYLFTYAHPSPARATIPSFIVSFLLYLGLSWRSRGRFAGAESEHLSVRG